MSLFQSIRLRIIVACIFFAVIVNIFFGYSTLTGLEWNEDEMFNWHISQEVDRLLTNYEKHPDVDPNTFLATNDTNTNVIITNDQGVIREITAYFPVLADHKDLQRLEDINHIYAKMVLPIIPLKPGFTLYEVHRENTVLHIIRAALPDNNTQFLFYITDVSDFNSFESSAAEKIRGIFINNLILILILGLLIGLQLARRVVSPLTRLTRSVEQVGNGQMLPGDESYYNDEVGYLAQRIDGFITRTAEFLAREKAFTRDASHELRTPIASSRAALELAMSLPQASETNMAKYLSRIDRANKNMSHLIETFLIMGREKNDAVEKTTFNLFNLIDNAFEKQFFLKKNNQVQCINQIDPELYLIGQEQYLAITIDNLIRNAFQHTVTGAITVSGNHQQIVVEDTGEGFDMTSPNSSGVRSVLEKAGFGLSIVQRICTDQGWSLSVSSQPQTGTRVSIGLNMEHHFLEDMYESPPTSRK